MKLFLPSLTILKIFFFFYLTVVSITCTSCALLSSIIQGWGGVWFYVDYRVLQLLHKDRRSVPFCYSPFRGREKQKCLYFNANTQEVKLQPRRENSDDGRRTDPNAYLAPQHSRQDSEQLAVETSSFYPLTIKHCHQLKEKCWNPAVQIVGFLHTDVLAKPTGWTNTIYVGYNVFFRMVEQHCPCEL